MTIYEAVETISAELSALIDLYFDPNDYAGLDLTSDAFDRRVKRALFDLLHECNRLDVPESARLPFLEWVIKQARYDAYEAGVLTPDEETFSKVKPTNSVSIKSTSVSYGQSDYEIVRDDRRELYKTLSAELDRDWVELAATLRKLRW